MQSVAKKLKRLTDDGLLEVIDDKTYFNVREKLKSEVHPFVWRIVKLIEREI